MCVVVLLVTNDLPVPLLEVPLPVVLLVRLNTSNTAPLTINT